MITDTSEFINFSLFNSSGVTVTDTLNDWRKKNNGTINFLSSITNNASSDITLNSSTGLITIKDGSVTANKIPIGSITGARIANLTLNDNHLASNSVTTLKISEKTITSSRIGDGQVQEINIGENSVSELKISDAAISTSKIKSRAILSNNIGLNEVQNDNIADNAVVARNILDGSISSNKIGTNEVRRVNIADNSINFAKIESGAVSHIKLSPGGPTWTAAGNMTVRFGLNVGDGGITTAGLINATGLAGISAFKYGFVGTNDTYIESLQSGSAGVGISLIANSKRTLTCLNGLIGIGTSTPQAPLDVQTNIPLSVYRDVLINGRTTRDYISTPNNTANELTSIRAVAYITAAAFVVASDERIKTNIRKSNAKTDLDTILKIDITDYEYKDILHNSNKSYKKVVAQQVEKVYPKAVQHGIGFLPDIYKLANIQNEWIVLDNDLKKGDIVRIITENKQEDVLVIEAKPDMFYCKFKEPFNSKNGVFVYGKQVNDFKTVDYDAISMLNVSATQEIERRLKILESLVPKRLK